MPLPANEMRLTHHAKHAFEFDATRKYVQSAHDFKPRGLWLSVDGDWRRWCEGEDFNLDGFAYQLEVAFASDAHILHLKNVGDIDLFTKVYDHFGGSSLRSINWPRLAREYDGIMIAPYQWERRLDPKTSWYYLWDCASACVWNLSALIVNRGVSANELSSPT